MPVFEQLGGTIVKTQFSDNFTRANAGTLGPNWIQYLGVTGANTVATAIATIVGNQAVFQGTGNNNPNQFYTVGFLPKPVLTTLYTRSRVFVEYTFQAAAGAIAGGALLRMNTELANGQTVANGMDGYCLTVGGSFDKIIGGGTWNTISAIGGWPGLVAGNLVRFEAITNTAGTAVTLNAFINGILQGTFIDNASPILRGSPGFVLETVAGAVAGDTITINTFRCGIF